MTENEWLAHDNPVPMLEFVAAQTSDRTLRLFLCACCARVVEGMGRRVTSAGRQIMSVEKIWSALRTVERFADGFCDTKDLASARRFTDEATHVPASIDYGGESGVDGEAETVRAAAARWMTAGSAGGAVRQALATLSYHHAIGGTLQSLAEHQRDMAGWLRDVVGNPFRPVEVDPTWLAWNGGAVVTLAQSIYDGSKFANLPILADALEEAGCTDADILGHCRGPEPHVRGCWVLDLFVEAPRRFAAAAAAFAPEPGDPQSEPEA
jgi:hypothetical protein